MLSLILVLFNNRLFHDVRVRLISCIVTFLIDYFHFRDHDAPKKNPRYSELLRNFMVTRKLHIQKLQTVRSIRVADFSLNLDVFNYVFCCHKKAAQLKLVYRGISLSCISFFECLILGSYCHHFLERGWCMFWS